MENSGSTSLHKTDKLSFASQILLRVLATGGTLAAAWLVLTSKQTVEVFGIVVDARYSYSSAFKFFAFANIIACAFSLLSLFIVFILGYKALNPRNYFFIFLHDLVDLDNVVDGRMCSSDSDRVRGEIWQQPHWLDSNL
ncbi:unnamed protein product [Fraxinus pennsylvanica]|uniref:CASP-like protein n=1 Tax=Fraxinus pennsylvanica TaxID=56036 RepID=A0AAD1YZ22_9LAMI|nr:unnamed protein product [Fraxinus pennsylvanica]